MEDIPFNDLSVSAQSALVNSLTNFRMEPFCVAIFSDDRGTWRKLSFLLDFLNFLLYFGSSFLLV